MSPRKAAPPGETPPPSALPAGPILDAIHDQDAALARLRRALAEDRVAHAYLFHGPRGIGKTRTALGLAQALNCTGAGPPCGACPACRKVARLTHPDVRLVLPATKDEEDDPEELARRLEEYAANRYHLLEFARNASIGIDRARELKAEAAMALVEGRRRVYIIVDAVRMTDDAAQSALKLIEEPPAGTHIILTAEEPASLLPTIVSRCQTVRFRPLRGETIERILGEAVGVRPEPARLIASLADGSLGRALALGGESSIIETRDRALELLDIGPDPSGIQEKVRQWSRDLDQIRARRTVEILLMWCHDLLGMKFALPETAIANRDRMDLLRRRAGEAEVRQIRQWIEALEEMVDSMARNVHPAASLHEALTRIASTKISQT